MDLPWKPSESESLLSLSRYASASELQILEQALAQTSPGTFALLISHGKWKAAKHLAYLDQAIMESIAAAARGEQEGLLVSMPPQHGKSELCSRYLPAWYLGKYPDRRVILTSYEADFAASWGRKARDLLESHGQLFGVQVSHSSSAANRWDLAKHDGGMSTAGVGGPITGKGAHLLIVDDPIKNDEQARSPQQRQKQWEWWQSVATTRLRPGALSLVIQTRWHRDDLTGRILEQAQRTGQRWRTVKFPAISEEEDILGRARGEALWPDVYSQARLEEVKKNRTNYYWQAMYQQNPTSEGSAEWPPEYFTPDIWFEDWPTKWICKAVTLDPSKGTESKFGDYSAFVMVMFAEDRKLYVDADLAIRNCEIITDTAIDIQRQFRPDFFGIETNQFQQLLANSIYDKSAKLNVPMPLWDMFNHLNKEVRIRRLTPYLARKQMRFKGGSPGARLLVEQLKDFPLGEHDDGPDALDMAVQLICQNLTVPEENTYDQYQAYDDYRQGSWHRRFW